VVIKEFPKKNIIRRWFKENSPWCPLFGVIPFQFLGSNSLLKNPVKGRCLRIIEEARELWDVRHPLDLAPFFYSWPKPEEASWYPNKDLLIARGIYLHVLDIFGAAQIFNPDLDPDQIRHSEILWHARDYGRSFMLQVQYADQKSYKGAEEIEDYKMFGIFSIYLAWRSLEEILTEEESPDSPTILRNLLLAEAFFKEAENIQKAKLKDRPKKAGQKGGGMRQKVPAVMEVVGHANIKSKTKTVLGLWEYLKKEFHGEKHFITKDSDIFFDVIDGEIENVMTIKTFKSKGKKEFMKEERISFRTFQRYTSHLKKESQ